MVVEVGMVNRTIHTGDSHVLHYLTLFTKPMLPMRHLSNRPSVIKSTRPFSTTHFHCDSLREAAELIQSIIEAAAERLVKKPAAPPSRHNTQRLLSVASTARIYSLGSSMTCVGLSLP